MGLGDIGRGIADAFSQHITGERQRTRQAEDQQIDTQMQLIKMLSERPDANPALLGKALHDLTELSAAKSGQRKLKPGMAGFTGATELPLSQFLSGLGTNTPLMGNTTEAVPRPELPVQQPAQMAPMRGNDMQGGTFGLPAPPQQGLPDDPYGEGYWTGQPSGMAQRAGDMAAYVQGPKTRPVANQPLLRSPEEMNRLLQDSTAARAKGQKAGELQGVFSAVDDAPTGTFSPSDRNEIMRQAVGLNSYRPVNVTVEATDPVDGVHKRMAAVYDPNLRGFFTADGMNHPLVDAIQVGQQQSVRPPYLLVLAAQELGISTDLMSLSAEEAQRLRLFMTSKEFDKFAMRSNLTSQLATARQWAGPRLIQGTDAGTGQAATYAVTPNSIAAGGGMAGTPVPVVDGVAIPTPPTQAAPVPVPVPKPVTPTATPQAAVTPGGPTRTPTGGILAPPTAGMRDQAAALTAIPSIINEVEGQIKPLNKTAGVPGKVLGVFRQGAGKVGANDSAELYRRSVAGFVASLSRFAGERGVLTDADVQRAATLLPKLGDSPALTQRALKDVRMFLKARMNGLPDPFMKGNGAAPAAPVGTGTMEKLIPGTSQMAVSTDGGKTWHVK